MSRVRPAVRFRLADVQDSEPIARLVALSAHGLSQAEYTDEQIDAALGSAFGLDTQLIRDGTYFVAETNDELVACGGWSYRRTLFGSDDQTDRDPQLLDPSTDTARIRAFFVHPAWARRGLGRRLLALCEAKAVERGFCLAALMSTLPGVHLYRRCGYEAEPSITTTLPGGVEIEFVPMHKTIVAGPRAR